MTVPHRGRGWQLAPALIALEAEADRIAPRRRRTSDGSIGDRAHTNRRSNHNPDGGFVDAFDLSHDPAGGMDAHAHVRAWVARQDPRLEEVISNRRIWTWARRSEGWRPYTGANPHTLHAHITVKNSHRHDMSPWFTSVPLLPTKPTPPPYTPPSTVPPPYRPPAAAPSFIPPSGDPDVRFFITHPSYGIRLVTTDGVHVVDAGVTRLDQLRPGEIGGEMHPTTFEAFCRRYPGGRIAMPNLP